MSKKDSAGLRPRGFTIIELLAVAAIIAILSTVVITSLGDARSRGRDAKRVSDIKNIELALKLYHADNSQYPNTLASLVPNYLPMLPKDPTSPSREYIYAGLRSTATGANPQQCATFHLGTVLETAHASLRDDADASFSQSVCTGGGTKFNGLSEGGGSPLMCGADVGTAGPEGTERCYDVRP